MKSEMKYVASFGKDNVKKTCIWSNFTICKNRAFCVYYMKVNESLRYINFTLKLYIEHHLG